MLDSGLESGSVPLAKVERVGMKKYFVAFVKQAGLCPRLKNLFGYSGQLTAESARFLADIGVLIHRFLGWSTRLFVE